MVFLKTLATNKLANNTANRIKLPHTLKSQKLFMFRTLPQIFRPMIDIHIFQRIESLMQALDLNHLLCHCLSTSASCSLLTTISERLSLWEPQIT